MWNNLLAGEKRLSSIFLVYYRASFLSLVRPCGTISMLERRDCRPSALFATERLFFHWSLCLEQSRCWREEAVLHLPCLLQSIFPFIGPSVWNNLLAGEKRLLSIFLLHYSAASFFFSFFFFFCPSVWDNHHFLCVTCPNFVFFSSQLRTHLFSVSCS